MPDQSEVQLYLNKAYRALAQSRDNLNLAYYDVAISRAYYSMFYAATALLLTLGVTRSRHAGVYSAFGEFFVRPGLMEPEYGRMLVNAFNVRLDSDCDVTSTFNRALAEDVLADGQRFVEQAASYLRNEGHDV